jgi:hypothetical protein
MKRFGGAKQVAFLTMAERIVLDADRLVTR